MILAFLSVITNKAQDINFTLEDGLPSNMVYKVFQSSTGFLWLCTDSGLSRYDGNQFVNFSVEDGLPDNEIFDLFEDSKGRIWMFSYNGKIAFISNELNLKITLVDTASFKGRISQIIEHNDQIWLSSVQGGIITLNDELEVEKVDIPQAHIHYMYFDDSGYLNYCTPSLFRLVEGVVDTIHNISSSGAIARKYLSESDGVYFFWVSDNYIFHILGEVVTRHTTKYPVYNLLKIENRICVFTSNGIYFLSDLKKIVYEEPSATSYIKDRNDGKWIFSLKDGLYKLETDRVFSEERNSLFPADKILSMTGKGDLLQIFRNISEAVKWDYQKSYFVGVNKDFHDSKDSIEWAKSIIRFSTESEYLLEQ